MQFRLIPSASLQGSRAFQSDSGWCVPTGTYSLGTFFQHTHMTTIHNEEGKKVRDLEGCRSHKSSDGSDGTGAVREGFVEEGDVPGGFSSRSQVKGGGPDRQKGNKRRQKLDDWGWL